ncbi:C25 family cysteine peptidase [Pontibacter toksunensis]|uniref:C25 family cysteine peptidase n=1 Tax=Pontibacter toksunensis TaxID=1332631 RepID=A0ABW6BVU0_9BACT
MMKRLLPALLFLITCFAAGTAQAQEVYGNEWINYSQTYYKISVVNTGLHRLDREFLEGLGLRGVNPQHLQLFRRGKEVSVYVAGEADGRLDAQDYVEFYGERNDGAMDRELYKNPAHQVHQFYSLYTDTAAYFLTVNAAGGKRMRESNPSVSGRTPEPYHLQKAVSVRTDRFNYGKLYDVANRLTRMPWMDEGEGYFSANSISVRNYEINNITNLEPSGPRPVVEYATVGAYHEYHKLNVNVVAPTGTRKLKYFEYDFYASAKDQQTVEFSDINTQGVFTIQVAPVATPTNGNSISFAYGVLTYPQKPVFTGAAMYLYTDSTKSANPYFSLSDAPSTAVAYDVSDPYNITRIAGHADGSRKGFVIDAGNGKTHKVLVADTSIPLTPVRGNRSGIKFRSIDPANHNYIVLTNKRLMKVAGGSRLPAPMEYAAYRASVAGGGYDTLLFNMEQVINLFHYGDYSSNAIRRMTRFMGTSPRSTQLFIIGKGVTYADQQYFSEYYPGKFSYYQVGARHPKVYEMDLVPTGIVPSSDLVFSADFRYSSYIPIVPTGRISVTTPEAIIAYLNKVKEHDAVKEGEPWRKNILQLGGGKTPREISQITNYLQAYARIAEGPLLGANVFERYRQNVSEVTEFINVSEQLNKGLSLITFFGHSSTSTNDLDIGYVSSAVNNYQNKGKYPIMLMNGCNLGNSFVPNYITFGEDWLLTPNKGAVALIAHIDAGDLNLYLNLYSSNFYKVAFQDPKFWGASLGEVQQETIKRVMQGTASSHAIATVLEMTLQGDPALKPYNPSKPDYVIKESGFEITGFDGGGVTASADSFMVSFDVDNLGKAITDPIHVSVKRTLSDNSVILKDAILIDPIIKGRRVTLKIPNKDVMAAGMNSFEIKLDSPDAFEELNEENNVATFQHFFPISGIKTVYPANYSIIGTDKVKLAVQSTAINDDKGYYFEIDTSKTFRSSLRQSQTVTNTGVPVWEVSLPSTSKDSVVYYWRARFTQYEAGEDTVWATSSFRRIAGAKGGWSQSHYGQLQDVHSIGFDSLTERSRTWQFKPIKRFINIKTAGGDIRYVYSPYGLYLDGVSELNGACGNPASSAASRFYFIVIDNVNLEVVTSLPGQTFCSQRINPPYLFDTGDLSNPANVTKMEAFLDAVPAGYYVAGISINKVPFSNFTSEAKAAFRRIGSSLIDNLTTGAPFAIVGQKGSAVGTAQELTASADNATPVTSQDISLDATLQSARAAGTITSVTIGPALKWETLHHNIERYKGGSDKYTLKVIGIDTTGQEDVLVEKVQSKVLDISSIDAKLYPNLKLSAFLSDSTARTAPQLKQWFVYYEGVPEGVVRPDLVKISSGLLSEQASGGHITAPMAFQNISNTAFRDSLVVEVTLSGDGVQPAVSRFKIKPVAAGETVTFTYTSPTQELEGNYKLSMYVNPRLQLEQHYFNNIYEVSFSVKPKLHPIMDVAFDGVHILDGDLVSPSPVISVTLKDENRHTFLQDPSAMSIILINSLKEETVVSLVNNPQEVTYVAATEQNDFKLEYKPLKLEDDKYTMEVRAKDSAGKDSGISPYRIGFEVVSEAGVTNFYPFPNPFSTKTNFIFTLTGSTIPEHMKIQILTVTGKVVKEIMKEELGPLRIGNNKTEYAWDGTDMYGDKLANGVYLYRVVMSRIDEEMKHRNTFGDKAFKNGYGKLYILR